MTSDTSISDAELRQLLESSRVIAVVGHSDKAFRPSYGVARYLRRVGYTVYAVNPTIRYVGEEPSYPNLASIEDRIDIVDVFRRPEHLPQVVEDAIAIGARAIWGQLGVVHSQAAGRAREAGLCVVMNHCIKIEHERLGIPPRA